MLKRFEDDPGFDRTKPTRGFTIIELIICVFIVAILIALLLPATRSSTEAARRSQCVNNLKQIGLAFYNYNSTHGGLPPEYTADVDRGPLQSWRTLILPFDEQRELYETIDLTKPWNDPANSTAFKARILSFQCPSITLADNLTTYLATVGPNCCLMPNRPRPLDEITDGQSNTLIVIEALNENAAPWMSPSDADETMFLSFGPSK